MLYYRSVVSRTNEVYAPNYENGEEVVLVRFPHAGRFEMPRLRVNNNNQEGIEVMGRNPAHAIGINSHVAEILSGLRGSPESSQVLIKPGSPLNAASLPI